jgi:hypothetical protein
VTSRTALALPLVLLAACRTPPVEPTGPRESLAAYARALEEGRAADAYRLLSDDARRQVSLEAFTRMVRESPDDVREIARSLVRPSTAPLVTARVQSPTGETLELVFEHGDWKVDGLQLDRYGQASPRQAIEGFLRAYERKRFDVILRYVPEAELEGRAEGWSSSREPLTAEVLQKAWTGPQKESIEAIVQALRAALPTATIEETEDRAALSYGAGGTVSFVRERGVWKLANLK